MQTRICFGLRSALTALTLLTVWTNLAVVHAAPFSEQVDFKQPDGTTVPLWGKGDEFYAVFETLNGFTVVFDQSLRAYCYARLAADGSELVSTGVQVQNGDPQALGLQQHLRINAEAIKQQVAERYAAWDAGMEISTRWPALRAAANAAAGGAEFGPPGNTTLGTKAGLTLLIDFDDDVGTIPQAEILSYCNSDNYTGYGNNGSVKQYYLYNSNGKLTYTNVVTIYIRAPQPKTYYNDTSKNAGTQGRLLITDALAVMKALTNYNTDILPLFNNLTTDAQNRVVAFNVFYAGGNGGVWSKGLWPHSWALASPIELSPGGKKVYRYQITNIGTKLQIGTFAHENGHMLCGYPDLYDYTGQSEGVGYWCLMAAGSWGGELTNPGNNPTEICAYLKRASGWATTIDLNSSSNLFATVSALPGPNRNLFYRYAKPGVSTEYYLFECRYKTNHDAWVPGSGVAVWHIDELGDNSSVNLNPNPNHNNYEATLVQADNQWHLERRRNAGDSKDLYYLGNSASGYANQLNDSTAPHAHWWDGSPSGLALRNFSAAASTMTFLIGTNDPAPVIVSQPRSLTVVAGAPANFTVAAAGFPPLAYQWRKRGAPIPGATTTAYSIASAQLADADTYSVVVTNTFGSTTSTNANLIVVATVPLPYALNNSNLTWTTDTPWSWYGQTNLSHDSIAAAQSGALLDGQQAMLRTTLTGPGTLSFWWKVSSQAAADFLTFRYGGVDRAQISGEIDWSQATYYLPAGSQTLEWIYSKDAAGSAGQDLAWVDQVAYTSGGTAPFITLQPVSQTSLGGTPVTFIVAANGTPQLSYQWRFNGTDIPGATTTAWTIGSPRSADTGTYSVRVTNPHGSLLSSNAALGVVPLAVAGDNSLGQLSVSASATNAIAIAAGAWHSLALDASGFVMAWGNSWDGQCAVPPDLKSAVAIAAGGYHSLALKADQTVVGWGANYHGQATPPLGLTDGIALAAGTWHSLALRANGTVLAWGDNSWGQCSVPAGLADVIAVAAGGNHSLALRADGTVVAWGENTDAQGGYAGQSAVPWDLANVVAVAAGDYHSLALQADGSVVAWGDNSEGQASVPAGLPRAVLIAGGGSHTVALKADGTVAAWGADWNGQCSISSSLSNLVAVSAGNAHTLLLVGTQPDMPRPIRATRQGNQFALLLQTAAGKFYALEYKNSLAATDWVPLPAIYGNGALQFLVDASASAPCRFYRIRQW